MVKKCVLVALIVFFIMILSGCGNNSRNLHGRWYRTFHSTGLEFRIEFFSDSTIVISLGGSSTTGTWSVDGNRVAIGGAFPTWAMGAGVFGTFYFDISGDTLTLENDRGNIISYTRIR